MSDRYELVGTLTREQAAAVAELLAGGSVLWCKGHTYPCDGVVIRRAADVVHAVTCKLFPDPHDEREPVGPCTCGATANRRESL